MASGAAAGIVLGLLVVGLLEFRDATFRARGRGAEGCILPVLALIRSRAPTEAPGGEMAYWAMDVGGSAVLVAAARCWCSGVRGCNGPITAAAYGLSFSSSSRLIQLFSMARQRGAEPPAVRDARQNRSPC
jgi:hypothetical protein